MDHGEGRAVDEHGTDGVEEYLEGAKEGLPEERVENKCFESRWEISVEASNAERFVVGEMVGLWQFNQLFSFLP